MFVENFVLIASGFALIVSICSIIKLKRTAPNKSQKKHLKRLKKSLRRCIYTEIELLEQYGVTLGFDVRVRGRYLYVDYYLSNLMRHELVPPPCELVLQFYDADDEAVCYQSESLTYTELRLPYYKSFFKLDISDIENAEYASIIAE